MYQEAKITEQIIDNELPEVDETICQACGEHLSSTLENVGFEDNQKLEIEYFCPNGCEQDELVIII